MRKTPVASLVLFGARPAFARAAAARGIALVDRAGAGTIGVVALAERHVLEAAQERERAGLPGLTALQALAFRDKLAMKRALRALGLPTVKFGDVGFPAFAKPRRGTSGQGRRVVSEPRELADHVRRMSGRFPHGFLTEEVVRAREVSVETFVSGGRVVFQSTTDYVIYGAANRVPAVLDDATDRRVRDLAARATLGLGLASGVTHAELFLTERGPLISEIAARPPGGHVFDLIERVYGIDPWDLFLRCVLDEHVEHPGAPRRSAGNLLLHPPPGRISSVRGLAKARRLEGLVRLRHRLRVGLEVPLRLSLGQIAGVLTVEHADPAVVQRTLRRAAAAIRVRCDPT